MSGASLRARFRAIADEKRAALVLYPTHGDPSIEASVDLLASLADAGAGEALLGTLRDKFGCP